MSNEKETIQIAEESASLIRQFLAGEQEVFHDLIRPYEGMYYRQAFSILRNQQDAEDAVQGAVVMIFTHLGQLNETERFKQWSLRIVQNEAKQLWRKRRQNQYESLDEGFDDFPGKSAAVPKDYADWRELPSEAAEKKELHAALQKAIGELPHIYREILLLRDVEQLNLAETMEVLEIGESAVKTRHHRARLLLREALTPALAKPKLSLLERWKGVNPWSVAKR